MKLKKVEAIKRVVENNDGQATLQEIYANAKKYKKDVETAADWKAGFRGVLYRDVRNGKTFKKIHEATYGLM